MTERRPLPHRSRRAVSRSRRPVAAAGVPQPETAPTPGPLVPAPGEPSILGFPAEVPDEPALDEEPPPAEEQELPPVDPDGALYVLPTADPVAGTLLLVAGAAGGMSLFLPWVQHGGELGLTLLRLGVASADVSALARSGLLLPVAVAVGGGVLFLLGLLAFRPAHSHRVLGVAALLVVLGVAAGIVVRVADAGWQPLRGDPGALCAVVLVAAGVLGALKAMLTPPDVTTDPR
jgi:hypothetical protein